MKKSLTDYREVCSVCTGSRFRHQGANHPLKCPYALGVTLVKRAPHR
jgi:hypothetical protein